MYQPSELAIPSSPPASIQRLPASLPDRPIPNGGLSTPVSNPSRVSFDYDRAALRRTQPQVVVYEGRPSRSCAQSISLLNTLILQLVVFVGS
jgi:hypothetical protein